MTKDEILENAIKEATKKEALEIAEKIRKSDVWDPDLNLQLCELAGLEKEYKESDPDNFEAVVFKAADILGVEII